MINTPTDDVRALRTMLPAPEVAPLSDAAYSRIEDRVLRGLSAPVRPVRPARPPRPARRVKVGVLVTAAAAALVLVPAVLLPADDDGRTVIGASPAAARVLDEAATAALSDDVTAPSEDQWVYVRSVWTVAKPGPDDRPRTDREVWLSQRPEMKNGSTQYVENGNRIPIYYNYVTKGYVKADINRPTYAWFASLPTDPDELKQRLIADAKRDAYYRTDYDLFSKINDLILENIVPPKVEAALYQVLTRIEGIVVKPGVTDAVGRDGIGITMPDSDGLLSSTLVLDRTSHVLLGSRTGADAGAVLQRSVVDHRFEQPSR